MSILALALGIGANTTMFSAVNALLLHPLPFPRLDRIVAVFDSPPGRFQERAPVSPANFLDWRERNGVFERIAAYRPWEANLTGVDDSERLQAYAVSAALFPALGIPPRSGRTFSVAEEQPGQDAVAVVSEGFWKRRLRGAPDGIGATVSLNGRRFTVIGVMPKDFDFPVGTDLWTPLALTAEERARRADRTVHVLARLRDGVSLPQARAEMAAIGAALARQYPVENRDRGAVLVPILQVTNLVTDRFVSVLAAAAGFVLLLACANVANLMLARGATRRKEVALRTALGAGRWLIAKQFLSEGLLIAAAGGLGGVLLGDWGLTLCGAATPEQVYKWVPGMRNMRLDGTVLALSAAAALLTGVLCGLAPAVQAWRGAGVSDALKDGGRGSSGDRRPFRKLLVCSEVVLAFVLLVGAGLMVKSFRLMSRYQLGYNPENLLTLRLALHPSRYAEPAQVRGFYDRILRVMTGLPEVRAASAQSWDVPAGRFRIEGRPEPDTSEPAPGARSVTAGYLEALGLPLVRGRGIEAQDSPDAAPAIVISESVARRYWGDGDPIGRRVRLGGAESPWLTVVGVVGDVRNWFTNERFRNVYLSFAQVPGRNATLVVRTAGDPLRVAPSIRALVRAADPNQPVYDVKPEKQSLAEQSSGVRISAGMMAVFAAIALVLAVSGIYALISYSVARRTREIGLRMALGATRPDVLRLVVGQALRLAATGLAIGLPLAFGLSWLMSRVLYGVVALDLATFALFAALLGGSALVAGYVPARRAIRVDPVTALHCE